jgi:hypothetical protein
MPLEVDAKRAPRHQACHVRPPLHCQCEVVPQRCHYSTLPDTASLPQPPAPPMRPPRRHHEPGSQAPLPEPRRPGPPRQPECSTRGISMRGDSPTIAIGQARFACRLPPTAAGEKMGKPGAATKVSA